MQIASLVLIDSFLHRSKHSYADHIQPFLYTVLLTENGSISVLTVPHYAAPVSIFLRLHPFYHAVRFHALIIHLSDDFFCKLPVYTCPKT